ncbi:MAG: carboxylesterase/lipase family protein [Erysipelotrichaceae bacterium]|nr:carboxylesterase/lipase family protein [Erysipelotrichaceae bacterium]
MRLKERKVFRCEEDFPVVETKYGKLRGYQDDDVFCFRGIEYAKAKRFCSPEEPDKWEGIRDALNYGYQAMNFGHSLREKSPGPGIVDPKRYVAMNEHCQFLNVWTKSINSEVRKPIMFYIHGGGFHGGCASQFYYYEGYNLADRHDVVVVTINHRLNMNGFLDLSAVSDKYHNSANAGIEDIVQALRWVRDNIERFGGDKDNVTIFGQSGGGAKVSSVLNCPDARDLFKKAIIESGVTSELQPSDKRTEAGKIICQRLGLSENNVEDIETMQYEKVEDVVKEVYTELDMDYHSNWGPKANDYYVGNPLAFNDWEGVADKPLMIGTCLVEFPAKKVFGNKKKLSDEERYRIAYEVFGDKTDGILKAFKEAYPEFDPVYSVEIDRMFRPDSNVYALAKAKANKAPVYNYIFAYESTLYGGMMSQHTSEVPFALCNTVYDESLCSEYTSKLESEVSAAWVSFASNGDPNNECIPEWKKFDTENRYTMILSKDIRCSKYPEEKLDKLLEGIKMENKPNI